MFPYPGNYDLDKVDLILFELRAVCGPLNHVMAYRLKFILEHNSSQPLSREI